MCDPMSSATGKNPYCAVDSLEVSHQITFRQLCLAKMAVIKVFTVWIRKVIPTQVASLHMTSIMKITPWGFVRKTQPVERAEPLAVSGDVRAEGMALHHHVVCRTLREISGKCCPFIRFGAT